MTTANLNASRLARTLRETEHAIDEAILQGADSVKRLIEGRREHALAAEVGQDAVAASVEAIALLTRAREAQIRSHAAIGRVAEAQGIGWYLAGPTEKKIGFLADAKVA